MLGKAALAMWWDVSPEARSEWAHWHAHEHFPERLALPGFLRASRFTALEGDEGNEGNDGGEGFFVMYELQDHAVLSSAPYAASLNTPSPWSTRMMPLHRNMVRTQCKVVLSRGAVTARYALTLRCSPIDGQTEALQRGLGELAASVPQQPGIVGLHVLRHEAPAMAVTTEQKIRGGVDPAADWVIVACGYELAALRELADSALNKTRLLALNAATESECRFYELAYSAIPADVHGLA